MPHIGDLSTAIDRIGQLSKTIPTANRSAQNPS
jgi:hypothetical protein